MKIFHPMPLGGKTNSESSIVTSAQHVKRMGSLNPAQKRRRKKMYQIPSIAEQIRDMKLSHPEYIYEGIYYSMIEITEILSKLEMQRFYPTHIPKNIRDAWWGDVARKLLDEILTDPSAKCWTTGGYMTAGLANQKYVFYSPEKTMLFVGSL